MHEDDDWEPPAEPPASLRERRFDRLWFAVTWLSVPLLVAYLMWRFLQ